tara:strand:- start:208 stop:867 length:660 start_codon:yes stop_codon:yes gene_type:complete
MANLEEQRRFNILTGGEPGLVTGGWSMGGGGNVPGEDGPYRTPPPSETPPYPPNREQLMIADGWPRSRVKIHEGVSIETGKPYKRVLPDYGGAGINYDTIRPKPGVNFPDLAHHGGHFGDGGGPDLMKQIMSDPTLDESDYERILGPDYENKIQQYQQQSLLISGVPYTGGGYLTNDGGVVNLQGDVFMQNRDGSFEYLGPYTEDRFGPLIPHGGPDRV